MGIFLFLTFQNRFDILGLHYELRDINFFEGWRFSLKENVKMSNSIWPVPVGIAIVASAEDTYLSIVRDNNIVNTMNRTTPNDRYTRITFQYRVLNGCDWYLWYLNSLSTSLKANFGMNAKPRKNVSRSMNNLTMSIILSWRLKILECHFHHNEQKTCYYPQ